MTRFLHEHCDLGRNRATLFATFAQRAGYTVIPGRYGGELNNDRKTDKRYSRWA